LFQKYIHTSLRHDLTSYFKNVFLTQIYHFEVDSQGIKTKYLVKGNHDLRLIEKHTLQNKSIFKSIFVIQKNSLNLKCTIKRLEKKLKVYKIKKKFKKFKNYSKQKFISMCLMHFEIENSI